MSPAPAIDPLAITLGYAEIEVRTTAGLTETVRIRLLRIAEFPRFFALGEKDEEMAEFITGQPAGWAATLTNESVLDLYEKGMALNFSTAQRWAEQRLKLAAAAGPFAAYLRSVPPRPSTSSASTSA